MQLLGVPVWGMLVAFFGAYAGAWGLRHLAERRLLRRERDAARLPADRAEQ